MSPALVASVAGGEISGQVKVTGPDQKVVFGVGAVIWLPGVQGLRAAPPAIMASKEKRFQPHVLAVMRGTTVTFPNLDRIFHNVFSRTTGTDFDLGLYRGGKSKEFHFESPGLVRIYCNIHAQMAAYVMVLDGPAFAVADEEGRFRIEGLPEGRVVAHVWHEAAGEKTSNLEIAASSPTTLNLLLDGTNYKERAHKNKYGEDYPPVALDDDRY